MKKPKTIALTWHGPDGEVLAKAILPSPFLVIRSGRLPPPWVPPKPWVPSKAVRGVPIAVGAGVPFLSIDPGGGCGWAEWSAAGVLVRVGLARPPFTSVPRGLPLVVVELPHLGESKASKADYRRLCIRMGEVLGWVGAARVVEIEPHRWKGGVPKRVRLPNGVTVEPALDAIRKKMTAADHATFERCMVAAHVPVSQRHNALDAVGIGIWWMQVQGIRE